MLCRVDHDRLSSLAAAWRGVPFPVNFLMMRLRLNARMPHRYRLLLLIRPRRVVRLRPPQSRTWANPRSICSPRFLSRALPLLLFTARAALCHGPPGLGLQIRGLAAFGVGVADDGAQARRCLDDAQLPADCESLCPRRDPSRARPPPRVPRHGFPPPIPRHPARALTDPPYPRQRPDALRRR